MSEAGFHCFRETNLYCIKWTKKLVYLMLVIEQQDVHTLYDLHMIRWNNESFYIVELNDCVYPSGIVPPSEESLESWICTIRTSVSCNDMNSLIFWFFRYTKLFCTPGNFGSKENRLVFYSLFVYLSYCLFVCLWQLLFLEWMNTEYIIF